jgi:carbon starvation protein
MFVPPDAIAGRGPGRIYGDGIGEFLTVLIGERNRTFATTFGAMAFSTFIFDTIDVATRLGRYIIQELFRATSRVSGVLATLATVVIPTLLLAQSDAGKSGQPTYMAFWTLFGTANQLLAALTLMGITVWLQREGKRIWFTLAPCIFVSAITVWSLILQIRAALRQPFGLNVTSMNAMVGAALLVLALYLAGQCARSARRARRDRRDRQDGRAVVPAE